MEIIHTHTHTIPHPSTPTPHTYIAWPSLVAQLVENPPAIQETLVQFLGLENSLEKGEAIHFLGFPGGSDGKESTRNVGDLGSITGLGRFPGGGHGNPLQYSCLENSHGQRSLEG